MTQLQPADESSTVYRTVLPGGLRVVTESLPSLHSAAVGVWVDVGSRDEQPHLAGAAHFLEHLLFKATPTRTATDIAQIVDAAGGELNAFTSKEHTCYYAHMIDSDLELAVDLVSDVVLNGLCRPEDVDLERDVVLEEIAMRDDDPEDAIGDIFLGTLFGDHPIGRPVIGTIESVQAMTAEDLQQFHRRLYRPDKMVFAVAGNVEHQQVVDLVRQRFQDHGDINAVPSLPRANQPWQQHPTQLSLIHRDVEQTHVCLGVPVPGRYWEKRHALSVLNTILGGGLSSRLFQQIRETRGLAYSVYSSVERFADMGALAVYAACSPSHFNEVITITANILTDLARDGVSKEECRIAKGSLRGGLLLGLEDSGSRMNRIGRNELHYGLQRDISTTLAELEAVTCQDINEVACQILTNSYGASVLGPYHNPDDLPSILCDLTR